MEPEYPQILDRPSNLPTEILTLDALRLQGWLSSLDVRLNEPWPIVVYGSVAVSVYLADRLDAPYIGETEDVDVWHRTFDAKLAGLAPSTSPSLVFRGSNLEGWLIHPDWQESLVDVSELMGLEKLQVAFPHPLDLILTKLQRYNSRDQEDCYALAQRYVPDVSQFDGRLEEAFLYAAAIDEASMRWIRDHRFDLFPELDDES